MNDTRELIVTLTFPREKFFTTEDIATLKKLFPESQDTYLPHEKTYAMFAKSTHISFKENTHLIDVHAKNEDQMVTALKTLVAGFKKLEESLEYKNRFEKLKSFGEPIIKDFAHVTAEERDRIPGRVPMKTETQILMDDFFLVENSEDKSQSAPAPAAEKNSPPKKAFFDGLPFKGLLRKKSHEEIEAEAAAKDAKFQASLPPEASDAEVEVGPSGNLPTLGLMKVSKK